VFEKNATFFTENWQKSQKIVIITSTLILDNYFICWISRSFLTGKRTFDLFQRADHFGTPFPEADRAQDEPLLFHFLHLLVIDEL
jgi:hypothetical protein